MGSDSSMRSDSVSGSGFQASIFLGFPGLRDIHLPRDSRALYAPIFPTFPASDQRCSLVRHIHQPSQREKLKNRLPMDECLCWLDCEASPVRSSQILRSRRRDSTPGSTRNGSSRQSGLSGVGPEPQTVQDNDCLSNAPSRPGQLNCETARRGRSGDRACRVAEIVLALGEPRLSRLRRVSAL
jgi:hypothetical protein